MPARMVNPMRAIFISYRRDDSEGQAGRLFDDLEREFGHDAVFMDVTAIEPGHDFRRAIDEHVASCGVLLCIIGRQWLALRDQSGRRRIDDTADFVRLETASALRRDIPVVPVLVQGATMPTADELPEDLRELAFRNYIQVTHAHWDSDMQVLIAALRRQLPSAPPATIAATPPATMPWWKRTPVLASLGLAVAILVAVTKWASGPSNATTAANEPAPARETAASGTPARETPARPAPANEPFRETSAREAAERETPARNTPARKSLAGRWSAAACRGGLVVTTDDGRHLEAVCDTGMLHRISGTYTDAKTIATTVTRIDPNGCESQAKGRWTVESDDVLTTFQEGWADAKCNVQSDAVTEVLSRLR